MFKKMTETWKWILTTIVALAVSAVLIHVVKGVGQRENESHHTALSVFNDMIPLCLHTNQCTVILYPDKIMVKKTGEDGLKQLPDNLINKTNISSLNVPDTGLVIFTEPKCGELHIKPLLDD